MSTFKVNYVFGLAILSIVGEALIMLLAYIASDNSRIAVYGNFLLEASAFAFVLWKEKLKLRIRKSDWILISMFAVLQILSYLFASIFFETVILDLHKLFLLLSMICAFYLMTENYRCTPKQLLLILKIVLLIGVIATLYNTVINYAYIRLLELSRIIYYGWYFRSFFPQRAIYGTVLSICAVTSLYCSEILKKKAFLVLYIWFLLNVILTSARSQMIAILLGSAVYLLHSNKYKKLVFLFTFLALLTWLLPHIQNLGLIAQKYILFFDHTNGRDTDITTGRLGLWKTALDNMNVWSWVFGNGIGSKDTVMDVKNVTVLGVRLSSFHNGYIDLLFETGVVGVGTLVMVIYRVIRRVTKFCPKVEALFFVSNLVIFLVVNMFDSTFMAFTTDTMAPFSTFIFICLPMVTTNFYSNTYSFSIVQQGMEIHS